MEKFKIVNCTRLLIKKVKKTEESYETLLAEMEIFSLEYSSILSPDIKDYGNRKEYNFLLRSLEDINEVYRIVQIRPVIMSLLYIHKVQKLLDLKRLRKIINGITNFHLIYNAICSKRTSSLEGPIYSFSNKLFNCTNLDEISIACKDFKDSLINLLPTKEEFADNLKKMKYSKNPLPTNFLCKHIVYKYEMILSKKDIYEVDGSIEHIFDEDINCESSLSLGNLVLLEQSINSSIPKSIFLDKKRFYEQSHYVSIQKVLEFANDIKVFNQTMIENRTNQIIEDLYDYIHKQVKNIV